MGCSASICEAYGQASAIDWAMKCTSKEYLSAGLYNLHSVSCLYNNTNFISINFTNLQQMITALFYLSLSLSQRLKGKYTAKMGFSSLSNLCSLVKQGGWHQCYI